MNSLISSCRVLRLAIQQQCLSSNCRIDQPSGAKAITGGLTHITDAVDRGVDVYFGTQTQEIRDRIREQIPEVTFWEPQMDWLNMQPRRENVGRLVFADRESILLATLSNHNDNSDFTETSITGAGENNALVILVREMMGSRMDHLDEQSEDSLEQLPF